MAWLRTIKLYLALMAILAIQTFSLPAHAVTMHWVDTGWDQLEQAHPDKAIEAWQQGVNGIADDYLLIQLGVYVRRADAIELLKLAGRKERAVILHGSFKGKSGYYVLSPREVSGNAAIRQQQLASLRESIGATERLYGNSAKKFKSGESAQLRVISSGQVEEGAGVLDTSEPRFFEMRSFILHDNTLISTDAIQAQIEPFLGIGKSRRDMVAAGKAIDKLYRSQGYSLSAVKMPVKVRDSDIPVFIVESPQSLRAAKLEALEQAAAEREIAEQAAVEKAAAEKAAAEQVASEKAAAEKAAAEQVASEKAAAEKAAAEQVAAEKAAAEKAAAEQVASEKAAAEKAAAEQAAVEKTAADQLRHWTLNGKRSLKENLIDLTERHQWKLVWEIPSDYQVGVNVALSGNLDQMVAQIVEAYAMRGVLLKITWFNGNKVMLVQRVYSENELVEAAQ